jgi:hypothetical protein
LAFEPPDPVKPELKIDPLKKSEDDDLKEMTETAINEWPNESRYIKA